MAKDFYKELVEYFKNTPREKVLEDWEKSKEFDNVGISAQEFIKNNVDLHNVVGQSEQFVCEAKGTIEEPKCKKQCMACYGREKFGETN